MAHTKIEKEGKYKTEWLPELKMPSTNFYFSKEDISDVQNQTFEDREGKDKKRRLSVKGITIKLVRLKDMVKRQYIDIPVSVAIMVKTEDGYIGDLRNVGDIIALACPPFRIPPAGYKSYDEIFEILRNSNSSDLKDF